MSLTTRRDLVKEVKQLWYLVEIDECLNNYRLFSSGNLILFMFIFQETTTFKVYEEAWQKRRESDLEMSVVRFLLY